MDTDKLLDPATPPSEVNYLIDVHIHKLYTDFPTLSEEENLQNALSLIDLSLVLSERDEFSSLPIHVLVYLLTYTYPLKFVIEKLSPVLFNDLQNERLVKSSHSYKLQGKVKPGSRLLTLGKSLLIRIPKLTDNYQHLSNLRHFILESLNINDKLSISFDWHMRNNKNICEYYVAKQLKVYNGGNLFLDYISMMNLLNGGRVVDNIGKICSFIEPIRRSIPKGNVNHMDINDMFQSPIRWILNEEQFKQQLSSWDMNFALKLQLLVLTNWFNNMKMENMAPLINKVTGEFSKFRKPEFWTNNSINSIDSKRKINSLLNGLINDLKQFPNIDVVFKLLFVNEQTFTKMKLKSFTSTETNKKRKTVEPPKMNKRRKVRAPLFLNDPPKPTLTTATTLLESVSDDIYFARGSYEEDPTVENKESLNRLAWKGMRCLKSSGRWMENLQSGVSEDGTNAQF